MKKLTDFVKRQKIETTKIETRCIVQKKNKIEHCLPIEISFTLEKFIPAASIRNKLPRKRFFDVISKSLMSVTRKQNETDLVHSSRDPFSICLEPFVSLQKLKLEYCEYFSSDFLTESIRHLILHDIKKLKLENIVLDYLEIGYMKEETLKYMRNCKCLKLRMVQMNLLNERIPIDFSSIELISCQITKECIYDLIKNKNPIDFHFETDEMLIKCIRNIHELKPSLVLQSCARKFYFLNYGRIQKLTIDDTEFICNLNLYGLEEFTLEGEVFDSNKLKKFLLQFKITKLVIRDSNISQIVLFDLISAFHDCLRELDIRGIHITDDFKKFMKNTVKRCEVYFHNDQFMRIKSD